MPRRFRWDPSEVENREREENLDSDLRNTMKPVIDDLADMARDSFDDYADAVNGLSKAFDNMMEATTRREQAKTQAIFESYRSQVESLSGSFGDMFDDIKKFMSEDEVELLEDLFEEQQEQVRLYNLYYEKGMKKEKKLLKGLFKDAEDGIGDLSDAFGSMTDIFNALQLSQITDAITGQSESVIDVMSDVARSRGMEYEEVKAIRDALDTSDLYDGRLNASDVMNVWRMSEVSADYLEEIDSYLALFQKETDTTNEQLEDLIYWADRSGKTSEELYAILDKISATRQYGADSDAIAESLSEVVSYLDEDHITDYIAAAVAAEATDLDMSDINEAIKDNTLYGTDSGTKILQIAGLGGVSGQDLQNALQSGEYDEFMGLYTEALQNIYNQYGDNAEVLNALLDGTGVEKETILKFSQADADEIQDLMDSINNNTDTVESMQGTIGRQSDWEQQMNRWSGTWIGQMMDNVNEFTSDHPILTSAGTWLSLQGGKKLFSSLLSGAGSAAGGGGFLASLKGIGSSITSAASQAGQTITSAASQAGGTLSTAYTYASNALAGPLNSFFAAGGGEMLSMFGAYAPAIPDAIAGWYGIFEDTAEWNNMAEDEKERLQYTGQSLSNQGLTNWGGVGSGAGRNRSEYLSELQDNLNSGTSEWIDDWVNTYWRDFDGELESAYDNYFKAILDVAGVDIGQNEWNKDTNIEEIKEAFANLNQTEIDAINRVTTEGSQAWGNLRFALSSDSITEVDGDIQKQLEEALEENYRSFYAGETSYATINDALYAAITDTLGYNAKLGDTEDLLQNILGDSYSRLGPRWWYAGDQDNDNIRENLISNGDTLLNSVESWLGESLSTDSLQEAIDRNTAALEGNAEAYNDTERLSSPFQMSEGAFGFDDLSYNEGDLARLRATIERDYAENGSINLYDYFGDAGIYHQNQYYNAINDIFEEMYGIDSSYRNRNGWQEFWGGQYDSVSQWSNVFENDFKPLLDGSHKSGLDRVPFDGYIAELHEGERVLTANQADSADIETSYIENLDETVVNIGTTVALIADILSDGFEYLGKKIDSISVNVNNIQRTTRTSMTSQLFSGVLGR